MDLEEEIQNTEQFYEKLANNTKNENLVTTDDFCNVISACVKEAKNFSFTEAALENTLECKLGQEDRKFVEDKYVELLIEHWLEDTFDKIFLSFNPKQPTEFVSVLNHLCSFHYCYDNFENLIYNNLITDLLESESNISKSLKSQETIVFSKLKHKCITNILVHINKAHGEIGFIKCFINSLKQTIDLQQFIETLELRRFLNDQITLQELLSKFNQKYFSSKKHLRLLKRAASEIYNQDHHYIEEIKKIVAAYLEPVTIKTSLTDGRYMLEVTGKHLVFSKVLSDLEQSPNFSEIEEVRFVNFGAVHIDANLTDTIWHGKNVVVLADVVIVSEGETVTWNVSGIDGKPLETNSSLVADPSVVGLNGAKGNHGESGGNVCILYGSMENGHNLTVISNGGNGSQGQNGSNGKNGEDGIHVDEKTFKKEFPPVSKFQNKLKLDNLQKTMQKVASDLESIDTFCYENSDIPITKEEFQNFFITHDLGSTFFEVTTKEGLKITFSFYFGSAFTFCQSYLLVKGSLGSIGEPGGSGGLGGKGGFAGEFQIAQKVGNSPKKLTENGKNGETGTPGLDGIPGKDGLDRGYMDYSAPLLSKSTWPKWFIPHLNDNTRLALISHREHNSKYVWCAKKQNYVEIAAAPRHDHFVGHSRPQAPHTERHESSSEDQVARKKTINPESILEHYKVNDSAFEVFNVENGLLELKNELEALLEKSSKQKEQVTKEVQVMRQLGICLNDWYSNKSTTINKPKVLFQDTQGTLENISIPHLIELVFKDPTNLKNWYTFQNVRLNLQNLSTLWDIATLNKLAEKSNESCMKTSEVALTPLTLLRDKYRIATLSTIADDLQVCGFPDITLKFEEIKPIEILEVKGNCKSGTTTNLTNVDYVENYICYDTDDLREEIVQIAENTMIEENTMKCSVDRFLLEVDCQESEILCTLKNLSMERKQRKDQRLNDDFLAFKGEVLQSPEILALLKSSTEQNLDATVNFEKQVSNNKLLNAMYSRLIKELKSECNLDGFTEEAETEFRRLFSTYIRSKGPFSETYRELLSYHFNVNILVYENRKHEHFCLISNHNPTSSISAYFLKEKDQFVRLNFDVDLANLLENVSNQGEFCKRLMLHIGSLEKRSEFEHLISSKPYGLKSYDGVDKKEEIRLKIHQVVNQEQYCKQIASAFKCRNDQLLIYSRVAKLKPEFIDNEALLHHMALHFKTEGSLLTCPELCFIINTILRFWTEQPRTMPLISWIIAAHTQEHWLTELALIELEFYLKHSLQNDVKLRWRKYLMAKDNRKSLIVLMKHVKSDNCCLTQDNFEEVFYLMSKIPSALDGLESYAMSEWKYFLKDRYWASQMKAISTWNDEELKELSFYLVTLENVNGMAVCRTLLRYLKAQNEDMKKESNKVLVKVFFQKLSSNEISFSDALLHRLGEKKVMYWQSIIDEEYLNTNEERTIDQLVKLIRQSGNTSDEILNILHDITRIVKLNSEASDQVLESKSEEELKESLSSWKNKSLLEKVKSLGNKLYDCVLKFNDDCLLRLQEAFGIQCSGYQPQSTDLEISRADKLLNKYFLVSLIISAIKMTHNINLRDTQKLALQTFLAHSGNTLAQISTGEGKSLIVVAAAIFKAINKQKVNIITSSKVLAERDAELYKNIFEFCGVTVGHNCSENIEERKTVYSNCQVIYGDLGNFQRDYLLDRFYNENILGDCTFETVIVDEVDSMLLDKGANILYLSHAIPGLDSLEPLFVHIWKLISSSIETSHFKEVFNPKAIKQHCMFQIFGQINKEDFKELDSNISKKCIIDTWDYLIGKKIIDTRGMVAKLNVDDLTLEDLPSECVAKGHLKYFLKKVIARENPCQIQSCHQQFVEDHLESWIKSAMIAMKMENGRDYIVDVDRTRASSDRCPNITIVDRDTGTDLVSSQWDEGLHQFLQLKHGCKLSLISLKNVFISNVSFLKLYKQLYGLTGTLGSKRERELLKEIYNVHFVTIPTARSKLFEEIPPVICFNKDDWVEKIKEEVTQITEKRSALIICESVNEVLIFKTKFPNRKVHIYKRDYEALPVAKKLEPGHIIISTNLAGRGTDIKLSNELLRAGGLHVCLTFLPSNCRVEEQAYGRAARNGEPGTAQMIFKYTITNMLSLGSQSKILDLKRERDLNELIRIVKIKTNYESKIKTEERWFDRFKEKYKLLSNKGVKCEIVKKILLQICLEKWTFWLDKNSNNHLENGEEMEMSFSNLISSCESLFEINDEHWIENISDPVHLTKLGLAFVTNDPQTAKSLFDRAIDQEPHFSESAYYYRVCAKSKMEDLASSTGILNDLIQAQNQLQKKINQLTYSMNIVDWIKDHDHKNVLQIDSFKRQQIDKCNIYGLFMQSIQEIVGHEIIPETLRHPLFLDRFRAEALHHKLIEKKILSDVHLKPQLCESDLDFVVKFGLTPLKVKTFLENYNFSKKFDIHEFLKKLRKECKVPSRELFWKELLSNGVLTEEVKYVFVDMHQIESIDPSLKNYLEIGIEDAAQITSGSKVWLYEQEELLQSNPNFALRVFKKDEFKSKIESKRYKYLKQNNVFFVNKLATFELVENISFKDFDSLEFEDFRLLDIPENVILSIINELVFNKVIREKMSRVYSLACDPSLLEELKLSSNKAYSLDVRSLLTICFAHRVSLSKAVLLKAKQSGQFSLRFLPPVVQKSIFFEMISNKVLKLPMVNCKVDLKSAMERLYPEIMSKTDLKAIFTEMFDGEKSREIVDCLIRNKWLLPNGKSKPQTYSVNNELRREWGEIETSVREGNNLSPSKPTPLGASLHSDEETISSILINHLKCVDNMPTTLTLLLSLRGDHLRVETPDFSLKSLVEVMKGQSMPINEIEIFSIKGFDHFVVLEEKRWTWKTKLGIFILIGASIIEVVIGAALLLCSNPLGSRFIAEGSSDMIYAINCMFTGHFSWKNYALTKLTNLAFAAISMFVFNPKCVSNVGDKIKSISFKGIKEGIADLKCIFNKESLKSIGKASSGTIVSAISRGVIYSTADYVIEPQLEILSETIVNTIYSDMDEIIDNYPCTSLQDVFRIFKPSEANNVVHSCFSEVVEDLLTDFEKDWFELVSMVSKTIKCTFEILNNKTISSDILGLLDNIRNVSEQAKSIFLKSTTYWNSLNNIISTILQNIENKLADVVDMVEHTSQHQVVFESFVNEAVEETKCNWKIGIKNQLSSKLKQSILSPLMQHTANTFATVSHSFITQKSRRYFNGQKTREINKVKEKHLMETSGVETTFDGFYESEFDDTLGQMLNRRRSTQLFVEAMKRNIPVDTSFIGVCCTIIPTVLKREGINCPSLEIIVQCGFYQEKFYTNVEAKPITSIVIGSDADLRSNLKLNKVLLRDLVDSIISAVIQSDPLNQSETVEFIRNKIIKAIDKNLDFSESIETNYFGSHTDQYTNTINLSVENDVPCQHSLPDGSWTFRPRVDVDLRTNESIVSKVHVQEHICRGFLVTLNKINSHISKCHEAFRHFKLKLDDFQETDCDFVLQTNKGKKGNFCCTPTKYELTVPISIVVDDDSNVTVQFKIVMELKRKKVTEKKLARVPIGPHIAYEISPEDTLSFSNYNGIKGYVILNKECEEIIFSSENCHVAGELVLYRGFSMQISCKVLFLGETLLINPTEDIHVKGCVIKSFKSSTELKSAINDIPMYYKDVQSVILYVGMSETLTMKSPVGIVKEIDSVLSQTERNVEKAKIIVCSLFKVEGKAAKIVQVNKTLRLHCGSKCYGFLDMNQVISAADLEADGKHIKKTVMKQVIDEALKSVS